MTPSRSPWLLAGLLALIASGCECAGLCAGIQCGPCPPALTLTIVGTSDVTPTVTGDVELDCSTFGGTTSCVSRDGEPIAPGTYLFAITAPGHPMAEATLVVGPAGSGCCACDVQGDSAEVVLTASDAGLTSDAGEYDGGGEPDGGAQDDACRPERVEFPMGGDLSPGTLCDEVYVCVPDEAAAARVEDASARFDCEVGPGDPCAEGVRCAYRDPEGPRILDEPAIEAICAVTTLEPPPERILCRVLL